MSQGRLDKNMIGPEKKRSLEEFGSLIKTIGNDDKELVRELNLITKDASLEEIQRHLAKLAKDKAELVNQLDGKRVSQREEYYYSEAKKTFSPIVIFTAVTSIVLCAIAFWPVAVGIAAMCLVVCAVNYAYIRHIDQKREAQASCQSEIDRYQREIELMNLVAMCKANPPIDKALESMLEPGSKLSDAEVAQELDLKLAPVLEESDIEVIQALEDLLNPQRFFQSETGPRFAGIWGTEPELDLQEDSMESPYGG